MNRWTMATVVGVLALLLSCAGGRAETREVVTRGSCAIVGMTSEQAVYLAKQRARAAAIEMVAGVHVSSSSLVTDGRMAADFIRSFSHGFIVREKVRWLPLAQYQKTPETPPIPEYGVELTATVLVPSGKRPQLGLHAELNRSLFRAGEKAALLVRTREKARVAVFNIMADGAVAMVFPAGDEEVSTEGGGESLLLPTADSGLALQMATLPGHKSDAEGFFIAAVPAAKDVFWLDLFTPGKSMALDLFFAQYATIASVAEDVILPYEVIAAQ